MTRRGGGEAKFVSLIPLFFPSLSSITFYCAHLGQDLCISFFIINLHNSNQRFRVPPASVSFLSVCCKTDFLGRLFLPIVKKGQNTQGTKAFFFFFKGQVVQGLFV